VANAVGNLPLGRPLSNHALPVLASFRVKFKRFAIMNNARDKQSNWSWWYLLFAIQFVIVLWPPFYNTVEPSWIGIPFFYWYQLLCVLIGAVLTAIVYFATERSAKGN
jgi:hypothetical protein